jgi:hypothetical protein
MIKTPLMKIINKINKFKEIICFNVKIFIVMNKIWKIKYFNCFDDDKKIFT